MTRRRLILYLLLNVIVSAVVVGLALFFYGRNAQQACASSVAVSSSIPSGPIQAKIVDVAGGGLVSRESISIENLGTGPLVLTGWVLWKNSAVTYTFPELTLYPEGTVRLHTAAGNNSASDLFWDRTAPVWIPGTLAILYDSQKIIRAFYYIP
jgi:competence protein ComEC